MAKPIRIPGIIDILLAAEPGQVGPLTGYPRLDRRSEPTGPLVNRVIAGWVRRVLREGGTPLPMGGRSQEPSAPAPPSCSGLRLRARSLGSDVAFLGHGWSRCPENAWDLALLAAVWERVAAELREEGVSP